MKDYIETYKEFEKYMERFMQNPHVDALITNFNNLGFTDKKTIISWLVLEMSNIKDFDILEFLEMLKKGITIERGYKTKWIF